MRSKSAKLFLLMLAFGLVAAACGGSNSTETTSSGKPSPSASATETESEAEGGTITIDGQKANDHGEKEVTGGELEVELDDFYFDPTTIKGAPGSTVKLELTNESGTKHNFTLEDQKVDKDVDAGEDVTVTVTMPQSGSVQFHCEYHQSTGMIGQLEAS